MGRYYCGDIDGKFWFAVQSSNDADNFGVQGYYPNHYVWENCCDSCPEEDWDINYDLNGCTESSGEHNWNYEPNECELVYNFEEKHTYIVKQNLDSYKQELRALFDCSDRTYRYIIRDINKKDTWSFDNVIAGVTIDIDTLMSLQATIALGEKIYKCLLKHKKCYFFAEC